MIGFSRKLHKKEQAVAQKAIQRNGFYAHIKLILKAMLIDENVSFRTRAANKIIEICKDLHDAKEAQVEADEEEGEQKEEEEEEEEEEEDDEDEEVDGIGEFKSTLPLEFEEEQAMIHASVRKYVVPKINMNATSYPDLIDWEQTKFSVPPLTLHLSDEEIKGFIQIPFSPPEIPCHTQAVERGIRMITEAATSVIGPEARDGFIRQKLRSRKDIGSCNTKKEFFPVLKKDTSQE